MAFVRKLAVLLLAIAVFSQNTECRSTNTDTALDYADPLSAGNTPEEGMQDDARDDWQADGDGDDEEYDEPIVKQVLLSKPVNVTANIGDTVWLPCDISNSTRTSPEVISWYHGNTKLLQATHSFTSVILDKKIKLHSNWSIEIPSVKSNNSGLYTCKLVGSEEQTVTHTVRVQPTITKMEPEIPHDRRVMEGSRLVISCTAEGYPMPALIWSKADKLDGVTTHNQRLSSADGVRFEQKSLVIENVTRQHEGTYICMAENGVGRPDTKSLSIQIVGKPLVHVHRSMVNAAVGVTAIMGCTVHYEPRSTVVWMKEDQVIEESADVYVEDEYPTSTLRIPVVKEKDFGTYTCVARNHFGEHRRSVSLVEEPVVEPLEVVGDALVWRVHSHSPLEKVELDIRNLDTDEHIEQLASIKTHPTEEKHVHVARYTISSLPAARLQASARASNRHGWSAPTPPLVFTGALEEGDPESIQAAGVGASLSSAVDGQHSLAIPTVVLCLLSRFI